MHSDSKEKSTIQAPLFYFVIFALSLVYYELILAFQLGKVESSNFFFLFFIPSQALLFATFCGIGNRLSSRIIFPVISAIPAAYYIIQTVYITNFGTLFSISMTGMGTTALGDFGWALTDSIVKSIPRIILILLPTLTAIICICIRPLSRLIEEKSCGKIAVLPYDLPVHLIVVSGCVIFWLAGIGGIRLFGTERPSPYYLMTESNVTTDASAHKLGVMTTALVEFRSYYFGKDIEEDTFVIRDEMQYGNTVDNPDGTADGDVSITQNPDGTYVIHVADGEGDSGSGDLAGSIKRVPWMNGSLDFDRVAEAATDETTVNLAQFFAARKPSETNEFTGMFEGYNLIYICAESFWNYACNEKITPTLYKMAHNGIVLNNYYNAFFNTTTNGEYAFCTGLWPDVSRNSRNGTDVGTFAQSASKYMPQGLGDLFGEQGIPSYAFHNYYGKYYRRILSWPNLGYKCRFTGDNMWFTSNWPASDLELMEKTVDDYIGDDQFNVFYMTFSGHGPFTSKNYMFNKNIGEVTDILGEDEYNLEARGYFCGELELDKAMEYLLTRLEEAGKLDNTVIVIAGDHYPYYLSDEGLKSLVGNDDVDMDFDIYKSSCIIYNAGMDEPVYVDDYCANVDIEPTILNLFNIPFDSRLIMGRDIFSPEAHKRATLYNMSFISDKVRYNYETGEALWTAEGDKLSSEEKEKYIQSQLAGIENEYNVSCKVIGDNFFFKAYEICGLLSADEAEEERKREQSVIARDESMNAEDEAEELEKELQEQQELEQGLQGQQEFEQRLQETDQELQNQRALEELLGNQQEVENQQELLNFDVQNNTDTINEAPVP